MHPKISTIDTFLFYQWLTVRICSDDGAVGWGQTAYWGYPAASERTVRELKPLLIGQDPRQIERLWQQMFRGRPFRGGSLSGAIAAIDIAVWDLVGRQIDVPAYQLLGGKQRDRVRLHLLVHAPDLDELVKKCADAKAAGYTAVKIDPLPPGFVETAAHSAVIQEAVERVSAVRDTVGWEVDLIVEGHRKLGPGEAIALAAELEQFRPYFYEDPIPHDSIDSHREIARKIRLPLAVGERHLSIYEFRDLLAEGSIQFVRPDVGLAGGLTHCKKIATIAEAFHAQVVAHNFFSPLLTAATAQLYASIPNAGTFEYWQEAEEAPPRTHLLKQQLVRDGGYLLIPDGPGLGVEVDADAIADFPAFETWSPGSIRMRTDGSLYSR